MGLLVLNVTWLLVMGEFGEMGLMAVAVEGMGSDVEGWTAVEEDHH